MLSNMTIIKSRIIKNSPGVIFALFLVSLLHGFAIAEATKQKPLRIGVIGGFSGPGAAYGNAIKNGIEMAREELGDSGLEFFYEDDQFISSKTIVAFQKLADIDHVDALMVVGSSSSAVVAPVAEAKKIPLFAWASDERVAKNKQFVLRTYMSGFEEGSRAAEEAKNKGFKRLAVVISTSDYAQSVREGLTKNLPPEMLVSSDEFLSSEQDYKTIITKSKKSGVDLFYLCLWPGALSSFAKQLKQLGSTASMCGCETLHDLNEIKNAGGAFLGTWFVAATVTPSFHKDYMERFHNDDVISGAAIHYDLTKLISGLIPQLSDPSKLIETVLSSGKHSGAIGDFEFARKNGDTFMKIELGLKEITRDGFRDIERLR